MNGLWHRHERINNEAAVGLEPLDFERDDGRTAAGGVGALCKDGDEVRPRVGGVARTLECVAIGARDERVDGGDGRAAGDLVDAAEAVERPHFDVKSNAVAVRIHKGVLVRSDIELEAPRVHLVVGAVVADRAAFGENEHVNEEFAFVGGGQTYRHLNCLDALRADRARAGDVGAVGSEELAADAAGGDKAHCVRLLYDVPGAAKGRVELRELEGADGDAVLVSAVGGVNLLSALGGTELNPTVCAVLHATAGVGELAVGARLVSVGEDGGGGDGGDRGGGEEGGEKKGLHGCCVGERVLNMGDVDDGCGKGKVRGRRKELK